MTPVVAVPVPAPAPAPHPIRRAGDYVLLARAAIDLLRVDLALRVGGLRLAARSAEGRRPDRTRPRDSEAPARAGRYARCIARAARHHVVSARCLHRALVLHRWLRREGLPSELRIGVAKAGGALLAHAWVELDGCAVAEDQRRLAPFARLDALDRVLADRRCRSGLRWA